MYPYVHSSDIYNSQDMEITEMPINRWMDKDIVYIYNGILLRHKNNEVMPFVVTWMDLEIIMLSKVSQNKGKVLVTQSCLTLCDPMDYSLPGSPVHGISQARRVDWVPILFSRGSSWPQGSDLGHLHRRQILYHQSNQGSKVSQKENDKYYMMSFICGI